MRGKQEIREYIWSLMEQRDIARFPLPCRHRIPNFVGAEAAAANLFKLDIWKKAKVVKVNPDSPQRPIRERVLKDGKILIVPSPRMKRGFILIRPEKAKGRESAAASIKGSFRYGEFTEPEDLPAPDLVLAGSVAVDLAGGRVGKKGGFSDLEWAILAQLGKVTARTPTVSTVHEIQIVERVPMEPHDLPMDFIITPARVVETKTEYKKPAGIDWSILSREKIESIPVLRRLAVK
jgi:5-formyltetrahydrofolate cyclo-ligase